MTETTADKIRRIVTPLLADPPSSGQVIAALVAAGTIVDGTYVEAEAPAASRDETADSIDPATGTLTQEAVARRAELALELADDRTALEKAQARFDTAQATVDADTSVVEQHRQELGDAREALAAAQAEEAKDEAELEALPAEDPTLL